jgi:hypothetical protein
MSHGVEAENVVDASVVRHKTLLWLWSVYLVVIPFYFMGRTLNPGTQKFQSGVPQVADYYLAVMMVVVFFKLPFRLSGATAAIASALAAFVGYTALINSIWAARLEDLSLMKSTLYYAYDFLLFATCLLLYERFKEQFLKFTVAGVAASVMLQVILSPLVLERSLSRQALFFNNENQLGYFCLLAATIFVLGARRFAIPDFYQVLFYLAAGYLAALAQCRAALVGLGVLAVVALLDRPLRLFAVVGGLASIYLLFTMDPLIVGKDEERLVVAGRYDTLATRGYDRILTYPEHILFGAGEGAYNRFRSDLFDSEIHSSFGTLLFSYGIPGTLIFVCALLLIAVKDVRAVLFLLPAFAFGTAHHGLRFAFFWTVLAFICCMALDAARSPATRTAE